MNKSLAVIMVCAVLVACAEEPTTPVAEPEAPAVVAQSSPSVAVTAVNPVDGISFNAETDTFNSQTGELLERRLVNSGKAGYLLFGPYVSFQAGTYAVTFSGEVRELAPGTKVRLDVGSGKGKTVHGSIDVDVAGELPAFEFTLPEAVEDFEVRVFAPEGSQVSLESYQVTKVN